MLRHLRDDLAVRLANLRAFVRLPLRLVRQLLRAHPLVVVPQPAPRRLVRARRPPRDGDAARLAAVRALLLAFPIFRVHVLRVVHRRRRPLALSSDAGRAPLSRAFHREAGVDAHLAERLLHPRRRRAPFRVRGPRHVGRVVARGLFPSVLRDHRRLLASQLLQELLVVLVHVALRLHLLLRLLPLPRRLELFLLALELRELLFDLRVDEVADVLPVVNLRNDVVFPVVVVQEVVFTKIRAVHPGAAVLLLEHLLGDHRRQLARRLLRAVDRDAVRYHRRARPRVARLRHRDVQTVENLPGSARRELLLHSRGEELIAAHALHVHDALFAQRGHARELFVVAELQRRGASRRRAHAFDERRVFRFQILQPTLIHLVDRDHQRLVREERLDRVEQVRLLLDREPALLARVDDV
mmetsp:Transcript_9458/g.34410  ORF Transcript_9458/g.34410 Transcript_9458/m.34410 type:complete len:412 (-) Transcript_9458:811-2046(-)